MRRGGIDVADTKTSAVDVVTEADRAVEELIRAAHHRERRPDDAILGEEGDDLPGTSGVRWVVDPIDGTVNYLYGLPDCAVSVAAEVDGERGGRRRGRHPDRRRVRRRARPRRHPRRRSPSAYVPTPPLGGAAGPDRLRLPARGPRRTRPRCVAALLPEVRDIRRMGSCALDLCHVAEGSADAYVEAGPQPWDWSAGGLVLREAGGRFDLLDGSHDPRRPLVAQRRGGHAGRRLGHLRRGARAAGFLA